MHTSSNPVAACLLLAATCSCAQWEQGARSETSSWPQPPEPAAEETIESSPPTDSTPARYQRGDSVLDACVESAAGDVFGVLQDVLLDDETGDVMGLVVSIAGADGSDEAEPFEVLEYAALLWDPASNLPAVAILVGDLTDELPGQRSQLADLFEAQPAASVTGVITEIAPLGRGSRRAVMKVQDSGNLLHRVLIEPADVALKCLNWLTPGKDIRVEGVHTRDATGKLLIASALYQASEVLRLRDESGQVLWGDLARKFQSARGLENVSIRAVDRSIYPVTGWILDREGGVVSSLCIDVDGVERALPWVEVLLRAEDEWRVPYDKVSIRDLPEPPDAVEAPMQL